MGKSVCSIHEQAYEERCPWCEEPAAGPEGLKSGVAKAIELGCPSEVVWASGRRSVKRKGFSAPMTVNGIPVIVDPNMRADEPPILVDLSKMSAGWFAGFKEKP